MKNLITSHTFAGWMIASDIAWIIVCVITAWLKHDALFVGIALLLFFAAVMHLLVFDMTRSDPLDRTIERAAREKRAR